INAGFVPRRRGANHMRDPRHFGGRDAHDGGGNQRIFSAWNITANRFDGDDLLTERDPLTERGFEFRYRLPLALREIGHLLFAEGEIFLENGAEAFGGRR